ncbi:MAG: adenylate/guanylate cyclase domain-containing protein [Armatimonadota bacterium]
MTRNVIAAVQLGGEERQITALLTDMKGFLRVTSDLSPSGQMDFLNKHFERLGQVVEEHQGTLDKFMGDALLVTFNTGTRQPDHAERAVRCAWDLLLSLRSWGDPDAEKMHIGVGISSGTAAVGNLGTSTYNEFTAIGRPVNEAALLSGRAKPDEILLSKATRGLAEEVAVVDETQVEGVFRLTGVRSARGTG